MKNYSVEDAEEIELLKKEINTITRKIMCHNHMALEGKSIEWLRVELKLLKKLYR